MADDIHEESDLKKFPAFVPDDIPYALTQLSRYGEAISKEFTLVSDRMSWLVISNSFLFSGFITAAVNYAPSLHLGILVAILLILVPLLAVAMCIFVIQAIDAAHSAAYRQKNNRAEFENRLPEHLRITVISSKDNEHSKGNLPPYWIPRILVAVWLFLLLLAIVQLLIAC
ncbi:MAG: hypothetical protein RLZZ396_2273 [Planctomycetota bacterium]|jgi:hypothetical protein